MASLVLPMVAEDQALQEAGLGVLRVLGQIAVGVLERGGQLALAELQVDVLDFVGPHGEAGEHDAGNNRGKET